MKFKKILELPEFKLDVKPDKDGGWNTFEWSGSQAPCPIVMSDRLRVFFSSRDRESRTLPFYYDLNLDTLAVEGSCRKPFRTLGKPGEFHDSGIMYSQVLTSSTTPVITDRVFFTGWNKGLPKGVRYRTACGWNGNYYPLIDKNMAAPVGSSMPFLYKGSIYYMADLYWKDNEPFYNIACQTEDKEATYQDTVFTLENNEGGLARPVPFELNGKDYMIVSVRGSKYYRTTKSQSYKLNLCELTDSGWIRYNKSLEIENGTSDFMQAYGYPIKVKDQWFLFYNNHFTSYICVARIDV